METLPLSLPTWDQIYRIFPVSLWTIGMLGAGYYVGRRSTRDFLDYLIREREKK